MSLNLLIVSVALQSLFVLIIGQTCRNLSIYAPCSTNPDCGCLPFSSSDDTSGVCAYLHLNVSKLKTCDETNYYCDQPYTLCVHHPNLLINKPLCYPTGMSAVDICPPLYTSSTLSSTPIIPIEETCNNLSWAKRGITVAGSNFSGVALNQLRGPTAILFELKTNTLYISDNGNARIVTWQQNATRGSIIAGDNGQGNRTDQLGWVADILIDPKDGSLIVCDASNRRVVRWLRRAQQGIVLIDNLYCTGLALDKQGLLYITEHDNHRVTQWILGDAVAYNQIVAGGNGKGNRFDQLDAPTAVFVDGNRSVYVADHSNDRIMKWIEGSKEGILVGKLRWPRTVHVDQSGNIYSIDGYYSRVIRWVPNNINGTIIIGEQQYTLSQATDLAFDRHGHMYVSNHGTGRVDMFHIDRSACV